MSRQRISMGSYTRGPALFGEAVLIFDAQLGGQAPCAFASLSTQNATSPLEILRYR